MMRQSSENLNFARNFFVAQKNLNDKIGLYYLSRGFTLLESKSLACNSKLEARNKNLNSKTWDKNLNSKLGNKNLSRSPWPAILNSELGTKI